MKDSLLKIKKDISELKYRHSFFFFFLENLRACTKETEKKKKKEPFSTKIINQVSTKQDESSIDQDFTASKFTFLEFKYARILAEK